MASLKKILAVLLLASAVSVLESLPHDLKKRRLANLIRRRRSPASFYNPWTPPYLTTIIKIPVQQGLTLWEPPRAQINRPYFIPVLGAAGKQPLYFPPQSLSINAGFPVDNPPNNAYLPPKPSDNGTDLSNKFDIDGQPVWDMMDNDKTTKPVQPTRRPIAPTSTYPPIIRDPTTTRRPPSTTITTTTRRPPSTTTSAAQSSQPENLPSRCVWAIISCCSASSNAISYDCFEQLGCNGAFWGAGPCDSDIARSAISNVMNYYQTR